MRRKIITLASLTAFVLTTACLGHLSSQQRTAAEDSLKSLRKLDAGMRVGVSYTQYGSLVVEAQAKTDEALVALPNGDLKREIKAAMEAYADALAAWNHKLNPGRYSLGSNEILPSYRQKYPELGSYTYEYDELIVKLGEIAHKHLDRATSLLQT